MVFKFKINNLKCRDKELKKLFKRCNNCNQLLLVDKFSKRKISKDGYRNECKKCHYDKSRVRHTCICLQCGKEFKSTIKNAKFCNQKCMGKWKSENLKGENSTRWSERIFKPCDYCGKEIEVLPYRHNRSEHHFCSVDCHDKWQKETDLNKGANSVNYSEKFIIKCSYCGENLEPMTKCRINSTKHHFCSVDCKSKWMSENFSREKSPNWNPNITDEERELGRHIPGMNEWRRSVFERDNYTCQCCGDNKGGNLVAHHLNGYNWDKEHRIDKLNGLTLCESCHNELHSIYGRGNNTIEQFREFLYNKYLQTKNLKYLATLEDIDIRKYVMLTNNLSLPI